MSRKSLLKVAMLAVAGSALSAEAQVTLFSSRPHTQNNNNGTITSTGFSSGNIGAGLEERWMAAPFKLNSNSTITQIQASAFVPAGSEFQNLAWRIWSRPAGNPAPTAANLIASGQEPYPTPIIDPLVPLGGAWLHTITLTTPLALAAGDYYLTLYGKDPVAANTAGLTNFAWFANAQLDNSVCPPNTPIPLSDASGSFMWRSTNFTASGFAIYRPATITVAATPAWGPVPQNPLYLWSQAFTIIGNGTPPQGACCMSDGQCTFGTAAACCTAGGIYAGDTIVCGNGPGQANCPQPGACCLEDGSCTSITSAGCTAQGGIFRGAGVVCGNAAACIRFGFTEDQNNEAGNLPASATSVNGLGQPLTILHGEIQLEDIDMYKIQICNRTNFKATTVGGGNALDTILFLFNSTGRGLSMADDSPGIGQFSTITSQFVTTNGTHYLAVSTYNNTTSLPNLPYAGTDLIWLDHSAAPQVEYAADGPGAANPITGWGTVSHDVLGVYTVRFTGTCFVGCYANCDGSTGTPQLTANDFQCFIDSYAGGVNGTGYANCDGSTGIPALTANDFQCFINAFAAGCNP